MPSYLLCHRHRADECRFAFAAWRGFASTLRHGATLGSCAHGGHELWWRVEAPDAASALALLPEYVAERTETVRVSEIAIP
jgi:hypothetical protein